MDVSKEETDFPLDLWQCLIWLGGYIFLLSHYLGPPKRESHLLLFIFRNSINMVKFLEIKKEPVQRERHFWFPWKVSWIITLLCVLVTYWFSWFIVLWEFDPYKHICSGIFLVMPTEPQSLNSKAMCSQLQNK